MMLNEIPLSVIVALEKGVPAVHAFREATGESAEVFAENAGIDLERLWAIEAGQTPTADEVRTIAAALGISADDLNGALE